MINVFSSSLVLDIDAWETSWGGVGLISAIIGAWLIGSALYPQYQETYKNKNTVGVNKPMFALHTLVAILFLVGAIFFAMGIVEILGKKDCYFSFVTGLVFALLNFFGSVGNLYIILLKLWQSKCAGKCGLSESEYYEKYVKPTLVKE